MRQTPTNSKSNIFNRILKYINEQIYSTDEGSITIYNVFVQLILCVDKIRLGMSILIATFLFSRVPNANPIIREYHDWALMIFVGINTFWILVKTLYNTYIRLRKFSIEQRVIYKFCSFTYCCIISAIVSVWLYDMGGMKLSGYYSRLRYPTVSEKMTKTYLTDYFIQSKNDRAIKILINTKNWSDKLSYIDGFETVIRGLVITTKYTDLSGERVTDITCDWNEDIIKSLTGHRSKFQFDKNLLDRYLKDSSTSYKKNIDDAITDEIKYLSGNTKIKLCVTYVMFSWTYFFVILPISILDYIFNFTPFLFSILNYHNRDKADERGLQRLLQSYILECIVPLHTYGLIQGPVTILTNAFTWLVYFYSEKLVYSVEQARDSKIHLILRIQGEAIFARIYYQTTISMNNIFGRIGNLFFPNINTYERTQIQTILSNLKDDARLSQELLGHDSIININEQLIQKDQLPSIRFWSMVVGKNPHHKVMSNFAHMAILSSIYNFSMRSFHMINLFDKDALISRDKYERYEQPMHSMLIYDEEIHHGIIDRLMVRKKREGGVFYVIHKDTFFRDRIWNFEYLMDQNALLEFKDIIKDVYRDMVDEWQDESTIQDMEVYSHDNDDNSYSIFIKFQILKNGDESQIHSCEFRVATIFKTPQNVPIFDQKTLSSLQMKKDQRFRNLRSLHIAFKQNLNQLIHSIMIKNVDLDLLYKRNEKYYCDKDHYTIYLNVSGKQNFAHTLKEMKIIPCDAFDKLQDTEWSGLKIEKPDSEQSVQLTESKEEADTSQKKLKNKREDDKRCVYLNVELN